MSNEKPSPAEINLSFREKVTPEAREKFDQYQAYKSSKNIIESSDPRYAETMANVNLRIKALEDYLQQMQKEGRVEKAADDIINQVDKQIFLLDALAKDKETEEAIEKLSAIKTAVHETLGTDIAMNS